MRMLSLFLLTAVVCTAAVTPPDQIKVPAGFKVELLREAGPDEGSWICMTQDDQGRLYISTQGTPKDANNKDQGKWGGMWRARFITTENPSGNIQPHLIEWEKVPVPVGDAMGMCWAFDSLYVSGMGPQGRGIYRCKSSQGDGNLDTATLFKPIPGGAGEHGAHAIVLGPDKKLYVINGNSTGILDGLSLDSPYRHWGEDDLLPRLKDPVATFFDKLKAPYGCVYRTDADGTKWELFAGGFRNPYDLAFNADGELFTYDSDMEWDRGLPWYRPTRILHVVPGGEYGFREGSAKWPAYFPDSLPAVADIGVGCPTGIAFYPGRPDVGTDAKAWPEKYRRALFLHDWTYGRILAVTLHEKGASYTARNDLASHTYPRDAEANHDVEVFLSGKGMPVTDLEFLRDGSMVFTVGGRGTAAALYRVNWMGAKEQAGEPRPEKSVAERVADLEGAPHGASKISKSQFIDYEWQAKANALIDLSKPSEALDFLLLGLQAYDDPFFRFALRSALEKFPAAAVRPIALSQKGSSPPLTSLFALARVGKTEDQDPIFKALTQYGPKLLKLRVLEVSFARQGRPSEERVKAVMEELLAHYPVSPIPANAATPAKNPAAGAPVDDPEWRLNREHCALLVWLSNPELGELNAALPAKAQGAARPQSEARGATNNASVKPKDNDPLPSEAPPAHAQSDAAHTQSPNAGLGPVPNPGADIFPGRKPAPFQTELGRQVIEKTLALMDAAPSQEEQVWYALCLRWAHGWTPAQRVRYFRWFHEKAARYTGGNSFAKFVEATRADAASRVPEADRAALAQWLRPVASPVPAAALKPRDFVKAWTLPELEAALDKLKDRQPDLARGKELYTQAQCAQCHLFRDAGGNVGPDLTAVAQRFGRHDILESITDPSKVVSEQYAMVTLTVLDGQGGTKEVSGLVREETSATITILTDPLAGATKNLYKNVVVKTEKAAVSTMPPGLLFTLTAEEVADLLGLFGAK